MRLAALRTLNAMATERPHPILQPPGPGSSHRPAVRGRPVRTGPGRRRRASRTSARSASASRWAGRCGASWSSASPSQLGELRLGFTQLAALYVLADGSTLTIGELAESINRSPSATSRLIDGLVKRRLVERRAEEEDRRQKTLHLTPRGQAVLRVVDRGSGGPVPVRGPADADGRARDRRDGRRGTGDPCHQPTRPPHPQRPRTGLLTPDP